jgi:hypothetical protein
MIRPGSFADGEKTMSRTFHYTVGSAAVAVIVATTVGLGGAGAGAAVRAPRIATTAAGATELTFTYAKHRLALTGPRTFAAGRIALSLESYGSEGEVAVVSFKAGYSFTKLQADLRAFGSSEGSTGPSKAGLRHLDDSIAHTTLYGGLDAGAGQTLTGTVVLPKAGTYYSYNDSGNVPAQPERLTVTAATGPTAASPATATVTAVNGDRFGGASTLPASGTIAFRNASTTSPHFLNLQQVKEGTTRAEVLKYLLSGSNAAPKFARPGAAGTDAVSPGHTQTLTYSLPKGEYVELCFFPDPKTGVPHALMGMIRVVQLK